MIVNTCVHNLTWSHLLCGETSEDIARYSVLHDNLALTVLKMEESLNTG